MPAQRPADSPPWDDRFQANCEVATTDCSWPIAAVAASSA